MSMFVTIDGVAGPDIATNTGWRDFIGLLDSNSELTNLWHLVTYGWDDDIVSLVSDIDKMLRGSLTPDQESIANGLKAALDGKDGVVVISDGTGDGEELTESEEQHTRRFLERITAASVNMWKGYP